MSSFLFGLGLIAVFTCAAAAGAQPVSPSADRASDTGAELRIDFEPPWRVVEQLEPQRAALMRESESRSQEEGGAAGSTLRLAPHASIQFEGGTRVQREARVVKDPTTPANHVLEFAIREPNVVLRGGRFRKARIQMTLSGNRNAAEVYQSVRMRLGAGFGELREFPQTFRWLMVSEWWNNAGWTGEPFPFRISVNVVKAQVGAGQPLHFEVNAQARSSKTEGWDRLVWSSGVSAFSVPIERWLRVEYYFREGDGTSGRFVMVVSGDDGRKHVVADVTGYTQHPEAVGQGDGLAHLNPVKLYTSGPIVEFISGRGHALVLHWDDLYVRACGRESSALVQASPCAAAVERMLK